MYVRVRVKKLRPSPSSVVKLIFKLDPRGVPFQKSAEIMLYANEEVFVAKSAATNVVNVLCDRK